MDAPTRLANSHPTQHRAGSVSGRVVVGGMLLAAVVAASVTLWHHWSQGNRAVAYWGTSQAVEIRYAPQVELLTLAPGTLPDQLEAVPAEGPATTTPGRDISAVAGLVHFRQALIQDASFGAAVSVAKANPQWEYAVQFKNPEKGTRTVVLIDVQGALVGALGRDEALDARPIGAGLRKFLADLDP